MARTLLLCVFILLTSCGKQQDTRFALPLLDNDPSTAFENITRQTAYVGDATCASCHEDIYSSYQNHGMARSYYPLTSENKVEPLTAEPIKHEESEYYYSVSEDAEGLYQEEYLLSEEGKKIHSLKRRMDFVMGSGSAARTYITKSQDHLYQLPLTWYTQQEKWDFSPGYREKNGRFDRLIPDRCMACHNGYSESVPYEEGKFASVAEGIGCERCHGPGALHVEERYALPEPQDTVDLTIVNPAHLSFKKRLDVCQQCHFSAPAMLLRENRQAFDFKPSELLEEHLAVFVAPRDNQDGTIDVVSHADRMRMSACFLETLDQPKPLECTTCHNPHEGFRDQGPAYFNTTCTGCHSPETLQNNLASSSNQAVHTSDANCFGCHMPKVQASDAPHSSFTDHYIRIEGQERAINKEPESTDPLVPYFDKDVRNRTGQGYLGMALVIQGSQANDLYKVAQGASTLEVALQVDTTLGNGYFLQGVALQTMGNQDEALLAFERAVRLDPENPERILALALAYEQAGRPASVIEQLYSLALNAHPEFSELRLRYGVFLLSQRRTTQARTTFEETVQDHPWLAEAVLYQGLTYLALDQPQDAEEALKTALNLNPDYATVLNQVFVLSQEGTLTQINPLENALLKQNRDQLPLSLKPSGSGGLEITFPLDNAEISIYAQNGTRLYNQNTESTSRTFTWNLEAKDDASIPTGIYLLQLQSSETNTNPQVTRFAIIRE